jgi:LuxR family maltose regulon positive regulatory protein
MNTPPASYLISKLIRPQVRRQRVARPRLLARLDEALHVPLTLVCAPAGYGKTTLLVAWLETLTMPTAWLSLGQEDGDAARFLNYVILALQQIAPGLGRSAQAALNMPAPEMLTACLHLLVNELAGMDSEAVLVLDDYHWVNAATVDETLVYLVEHFPPNLHLVIASRTEPSINLPRWRARAKLLELRATDLCFAEAESEMFINQVMALHLPDEACQQLAHQTEGWPAALQLATLSLRSGDALALTAGRHHIFEYLAEEVLRRQPADVQRFLLDTSILTQLTGPLCDALTRPFAPHPNGAACLDYLEHANLFTQAVDGEHRWYRYHALFADFLQNHLRTTQPERLPELHRLAAQWLANYGDPHTAFQHALTGNDFTLAVNLIESNAEMMERHGELSTLNRWLDALPNSLVQQRPQLCLARTWLALVNLDVGAAQRHIQLAEAAQHQSGTPATEGEILAARALVSGLLGDAEESLADTRKAFALLSDQQHFLVSLLNFNLSIPLMLAGRLHEAQIALEQAIIAAEHSHTPFVALLSLRQLGEGYIYLGRLTQAEDAFRRAGQLVEQEWGGNSPLMGASWLGLGEVCRQRNQLAQAEEYLEKGISLCRLWLPVVALDGYLWLAWLKQTLGQPAAAQAVIQEARSLSLGRGYSLLDQWFVQITSLRLNVLQGYFDEAQRWIQEQGLALDDSNNPENLYVGQSAFFRQVSLYALARFYLEMGRHDAQRVNFDKAHHILCYIILQSEASGAYGILLEGLLLLAQTEQALGNVAAAHEALHRALDLAAPERPIRIFLDEGEPLRQLLLVRSTFNLPPVERIFLQDVLAAFPIQPSNLPPASLPPASLLDPLTRREIEVLRLIAAGQSNQEIAAGLFLSLNTVKRHVSSIMQKLSAKNRTEAARLAQQAGFID